MENRRTLSVVFVILSIIIFIACLLLNFIEFQNGSSASLRSVIITLAYATVWILVLVTGIISRNSGAVKYCALFWFITFITSITVVYGNTIGTVGRWGDFMFPLILLFIGQWHGLRFFVHVNIIYFTLISVISLAMLAIAIVWLRNNKSKSE